REGGLGLAQGGYWGGVAGSPPGRAIVAAKPVLPETSWTVTGVIYKVRLHNRVGVEDALVAALIGAIGAREGPHSMLSSLFSSRREDGLGLGAGAYRAGVAGAPPSASVVAAKPVALETPSPTLGIYSLLPQTIFNMEGVGGPGVSVVWAQISDTVLADGVRAMAMGGGGGVLPVAPEPALLEASSPYMILEIVKPAQAGPLPQRPLVPISCNGIRCVPGLKSTRVGSIRESVVPAEAGPLAGELSRYRHPLGG
ncbi:unnamed protein product, partial [Laminaria digitata]